MHICLSRTIFTKQNVVAAIMTQISLKAGLKGWGKKGLKAAHSEMKQLHIHKTFKPKH
jgi:hypothetical protein